MRTRIATLLAISLLYMSAAEAASIRLAVFDFELEDGSAGASIAGNREADAARMKSVNTEVRRLFEKSGRYEVVDVDSSGLRACEDCDAEIARAAGAEQSLIGVVRRITRTEFVVSFRLSDAKTGAVLAYHESDLQMGADYSWSRGAARLIKDRLLETKP
jgi:hypothetical protein